MLNYLFSISIELTSFAKFIILIGSVILVIGALTRSSIDAINNSIIASDSPGLIVAIFYPDNIISFLKEKNRIHFGIIVLILGFYLDLFYKEGQKYPFYRILLISVILLYLISLSVAAWNRNSIIKSWRDDKCKYNWFINKLFTKNYLSDGFNESAKSGQSREFNIDTIERMEFVRDALGINIKFKDKTKDNPSISKIEIFQDEIRKEIEKTSAYYYLSKPKKLLNAFW